MTTSAVLPADQEDSITVLVKVPKVDHEKTVTLIVTLGGDSNWDNNQKALVINVKPLQERNINGFGAIDAIAGIFVSLLLITLLSVTKR